MSRKEELCTKILIENPYIKIDLGKPFVNSVATWILTCSGSDLMVSFCEHASEACSPIRFLHPVISKSTLHLGVSN